MIKITIAIPVYNAAKHLDVVFDSLMRQTMDRSEFEIICVNDCSTDRSKDVIEKWRTVMGNVVLIDRTVNSGGPVIPRNDAIAAARGEYIHFLDNDDFLGEEALERLYRAASENKSDVIFGKYVGVNGRGVAYITFQNGNRYKADLIADNLLYAIAPHKMFRRAFLLEHGFEFDPRAIGGNDDQLFVIQCFVAAKVVTVLADYPYYYIVARGGENLSSHYVPAEEWLYVWFRVMEFLDRFVKDEGYKKRIKVVILNRLLVGNRFETFMLTSKTTREQKIEWLQAANRFVNTHIEDELLTLVDPRFRSFWQAVKENNIEKLLKLPLVKNVPKQRNTSNSVKIKRAGAVSYKRPSTNAISATTYAARVMILVNPTIKGWFEVMRIEKDGTPYAEFIQKKDVSYTGKYQMRIILNRLQLLKRVKGRLIQSLKKFIK